MLAVLVYPFIVLGFSASTILAQSTLDPEGNWLSNSGPHGLSEILYAFASQNANNGSAFAGLNGNDLWFNTTGGLTMFFGRFAYVVPILALAGSLRKEEGSGIPRHISDARTALCWPSDWRYRHPLFAALLPGVGARTRHRAFFDAQWQDLLRSSPMSSKATALGLFDTAILRRAMADAFVNLSPRTLARNP